MAIKNKALTINFEVIDTAGNSGIGGEAENLTMQLVRDGTTPQAVSGTVTEVSPSGGLYQLPLVSYEMDADFITVYGSCSTLNRYVKPIYLVTEAGYLNSISGNIITIDNTLNTVSGNIASIDSELDLVTVSGFTSEALSNIASEIVTSGNIEGWNLYSDATLANQTSIINYVTTLSGSIDTIDSNILLLSGQMQSEHDVTQTAISGLNNLTAAEIAGTVIVSGNAENWSGVADVSALALQTTLITISGNIASIDSELDFVTVSGLTPEVLTQIVNSGNAANWSGIADISTLALQSTLTTVSGNVSTANNSLTTIDSNINTISGNLYIVDNVIDNISGIITLISGNCSVFPTGLIDGQTMEEVLEDVQAMANGKFVRSGDIYTFYRQDDASVLYTINISDIERTRI